MKFLIQTIDKKVRHDFSFVLLQSIDFYNWSSFKENIKFKFYDTTAEQDKFEFKKIHRSYVPIGSVEFVTAFLQYFYDLTPKPINIPNELLHACFTQRRVFNGNHLLLENCAGKFFVKSNDKIKGFGKIIECQDTGDTGTLYSEPIPEGNYQISDYISISSEWRAFVYKSKLVGLQNYLGEFTLFPDLEIILKMIAAYKSAPIAYTLDVGVNDDATFIIEAHPMMSVGLYGFADLNILPLMFHRCFQEFIKD